MSARRILFVSVWIALIASVSRGQFVDRIDHVVCKRIKSAAGMARRALPCKTCGADGKVLHRGTGDWLTCQRCVEGYRITAQSMRKALEFVKSLGEARWPERELIPSVKDDVKKTLEALALTGATKRRGAQMNKQVTRLVNKNQAYSTPIIIAGRIFNVHSNDPVDGSLFQLFLDDGMYGSQVLVLVGPELKIDPEGSRAVLMGTWDRNTLKYTTLGGVRQDPLINVFWGQIVIEDTIRNWW